MTFSVLATYIVTVSVFLLMLGPVNLIVVNAAAHHGLKGAFFAIVGTNTASLVLIAGWQVSAASWHIRLR